VFGPCVQRLATLEEMLQVTHSTPSPDTESASSSVTNDTNKAPEFRAPRPVLQSAEHDMSRRSATGHDKTVASSAAGNGCYTTPLTNSLSKRRKFNDNWAEMISIWQWNSEVMLMKFQTIAMHV